MDWYRPISREKYLKIDWFVKWRYISYIGLLWELQAPGNGLLIKTKARNLSNVVTNALDSNLGGLSNSEFAVLIVRTERSEARTKEIEDQY